MNMKLPACPNHPGIFLPAKLTCPLCAQEERQRAYERQRTETAARMLKTVLGLPRPSKGQTEETS